MLLYYLFWMFMGFIKHLYIIFGTNILTQSPVPVSVLSLFQCFAEKEYQTESKRNETFGKVIFGTGAIQKTWSIRKGSNKEGTRQGGAPTPLGAPYPLVGPSGLPRPTSFAYIFPRTLKTSNMKIDREFRRRKPL